MLSRKKYLYLPIYLFFRFFIDLKKSNKIILLILLDSSIICSSILLVISFLKYELINSISSLDSTPIILFIFISILLFIFSGQYNPLSRYINSSEIFLIASRNIILLPIFYIINFLFNSEKIQSKAYFLFWIINSFILIFSRFGLKEITNFCEKLKSNRTNVVAIYGAGAAGAQLASTLSLTGNYKILAFFDDSKMLHGRKLLGIPILPSNKISKFKGKLSQILFAIPSLDKKNSIKLIKKVQNFKIPILRVPSIEALTKGDAKIDSLIPIEIEDLLGRLAVEPNKKLIEDSIKNKNICITGAGGSIGTELCKQVIPNSPKSLIMIDSSETNLYHLEEEIYSSSILKNIVTPVSLLGNAKDYLFLKEVFEKYNIDVIFHAAAYKHVPLIEKNPLSGIENNVFSTYSICKAAEYCKVEKVILISTDKAVRPTNIMGASKRIAELIFQAFTDKVKSTINKENNELNGPIPQFSIVRFGNVLNSSGSVVPLFKKQISSGGPITLTHEKIIRYFMTVPEAAQLVIQASTLSKGGEVFLLDMGNPIKIIDLAKQMIRLSGFSVRDKNNPTGDIEILITGLRPGEKLYEELLIDAESNPTKHPLIFKANESFIAHEKLIAEIKKLKSYIDRKDSKSVFKIISELIPEWQRSYKD